MAKVERYTLFLIIALSAILYVFIGYFADRSESIGLVASFIFLMAGYVWLCYYANRLGLSRLILIGVAFRIILVFAFPTLSDDIFRFVWDGRLLMNGINPFTSLPSEYVSSGNLPEGLNLALYNQLNSPDYFTIYPPFAQLVFWFSAVFSPDSVWGSAVIMRLLIILAEIGTIYYLLKLADHFDLDRKNVLWYILNPLVILELTGNLHFEAFMIFFLVTSCYYIAKNKILLASLLFALSVSVKLLPLIVLPLFLFRLKRRNLLKFYGFTGLFILLAFAPLLSNALIEGMTNSISLYFQKFEFNASIYYIIRAIGFSVKGYNIIGSVGPYLALSTFILVLLIAVLLRRVSLSLAIVASFVVYLLLATTVHPWYITTILAFSTLTSFRFVVLWTGLIFLTYVGYTESGFEENLWLTGMEYILVISFIIYELFTYKKKIYAVEQ